MVVCVIGCGHHGHTHDSGGCHCGRPLAVRAIVTVVIVAHMGRSSRCQHRAVALRWAWQRG